MYLLYLQFNYICHQTADASKIKCWQVYNKIKISSPGWQKVRDYYGLAYKGEENSLSSEIEDPKIPSNISVICENREMKFWGNNHSVYLCLWSFFLLISQGSTFTKTETCLNRIFRMTEVIPRPHKEKHQNHHNELYSAKRAFSSASDYPRIVFSLPFCLFSWAQKILIKRQNWHSQIPCCLAEASNTHWYWVW